MESKKPTYKSDNRSNEQTTFIPGTEISKTESEELTSTYDSTDDLSPRGCSPSKARPYINSIVMMAEWIGLMAVLFIALKALTDAFTKHITIK